MSVRLSEKQAELEAEVESLRRQKEPQRSAARVSSFLDEPLSDNAPHIWEMASLRANLEKAKEEVTNVNGEYQDIVKANLAEFMTCLQLREKLSEEQEVTDELRESLAKETHETRSIQSEAFDLLDARECNQELITELRENNRALAAPGNELRRQIGERQEGHQEPGQLFRRPQADEIPVMRGTVALDERSRPRMVSPASRRAR